MHSIILLFYNLQQRRLRAGWRLLLQLCWLLMLLLVLILPASLLAVRYHLDPNGSSMLLWMELLQCLSIVATVVMCSWLIDRRQLWTLGFSRTRALDPQWLLELGIGFGLGAVAMAWIFGVEWIFGWIAIERIGPAKGLDLLSLARQLGLALGMMLLVGLSEEILSRGYHLKNLSEGLRCLGRWPAVILAVLLSSAVFGLLHAFNPAATWISNLGVGLAGVMLATARVATGSLAGPIGLHFAWNLVQGPILGFPVSGNQFHQSLIEISQAGDALWTGGAFGPEAGLLGCIACVALTGVCLVWGKTKLTSTSSLSNLVRYRRSAYAARNLERRALKTREHELRELEDRSTDV